MAGAATQRGYAANKLNQYTAIAASWNGGASSSTTALGYDASGNLTRTARVGMGNAASSSAQSEYSYDV